MSEIQKAMEGNRTITPTQRKTAIDTLNNYNPNAFPARTSVNATGNTTLSVQNRV